MSTQAAFDKAVKTVKDLKPEGDVKPTQDDQLAVSLALTYASRALPRLMRAQWSDPKTALGYALQTPSSD